MTGARRTHAELSERLPIIAMWADIPRNRMRGKRSEHLKIEEVS